MTLVLIIIFVILLLLDVFVHLIIGRGREWYFLIPFVALIHVIIIIYKQK